MFTSPLFLIAAVVGASIPLILHLMQKRNAARIPFPTLRFLQLAVKQSSRRVKMEHFLLWLLRTLIMICLGLAFAMPMLRTRNFAWLGNSPRDVAIVIDASYSMDYNMGRQTVWDKALDLAEALIQGLGENDRFCIYVARDHPDAVIAEPIADRDEGLSRLKRIPRGFTGSALAPALMAANDALESGSDNREREIYILTDGQALPWGSFGETEAGDAAPATGTGAWDSSSINERCTVFVTLLGADAPENIAPAKVELNPPMLLEGAAPSITTRLVGSGEARDTVVTLLQGDKEVGRRSARVGAEATRNPSFSIPSLPVGTHALRVETPDDNLPIDNTFYFLVKVRKNLPTLCVGTPEDTFFVRVALQGTPGGTDGGEVRSVTPDALGAEDLRAYAAIFLCNAFPMPGQASHALEQYVKGGGLLALFPGSDASPSDYQVWRDLLGTPVAITEMSSRDQKNMLIWEKPQHPLLQPLQDSLALPVLSVKQYLVWENLESGTNSLVTFGEGVPFLLDRAYGRGRVLVFTVSGDRSWSDFPLSPFFLPMIRQVVEYGAGIGAEAPYRWSCDALALDEYLPEVTRETRITAPDGQAVPVRSTLFQGRTVLHAENLNPPGIYSLTQPGTSVVPGLAINIDRRESDLTPIPPADLPDRLGIPHLQLAADKESLLQMVEERRIGRTFGEHLLWLALLLTLVEFVYANTLLKDVPKLSERLRIRPDGKVSGHSPLAHGGLKKGGAA